MDREVGGSSTRRRSVRGRRGSCCRWFLKNWKRTQHKMCLNQWAKASQQWQSGDAIGEERQGSITASSGTARKPKQPIRQNPSYKNPRQTAGRDVWRVNRIKHLHPPRARKSNLDYFKLIGVQVGQSERGRGYSQGQAVWETGSSQLNLVLPKGKSQSFLGPITVEQKEAERQPRFKCNIKTRSQRLGWKLHCDWIGGSSIKEQLWRHLSLINPGQTTVESSRPCSK